MKSQRIGKNRMKEPPWRARAEIEKDGRERGGKNDARALDSAARADGLRKVRSL